MTHNEALALLDFVVQPVVEAIGVNDPPLAPIEGQSWVVGGASTGPWAGRANAIAGWTAGGWRFVDPFEGLTVWVVADGQRARYSGGEWRTGDETARRVLIGGKQVLGEQRAGIAGPAGGTVVDVEARAALDAVLAVLRGHGLIQN